MSPAPQHARKIPVPWSRRWREIRIQVLPGLVFVLVSLVVVSLWRDHVRPVRLTGQAMGREMLVRSPRDGWVGDFNRHLFDNVAAGDALLRVYPANADELQARLAVLRAEMEQIEVGRDPVTGPQRNLVNLEELRLDWVRARVDLAEEKLEAAFWMREYERNVVLFEGGFLPEAEYDHIRTRRDQSQTRVEETGTWVDALAGRLAVLRETVTDPEDLPSVLGAALRVKERELEVLETQLAPARLASPVHGRVGEVHTAEGAFVSRGDPLLTLRVPRAEAVVAYLRQPLRQIPEPGTRVEIWSRGRSRVSMGTVTQVGAHLEAIPPAIVMPGQMDQKALPLRIEPDSDDDFLPGEFLEIRFSAL